MRSNIDPNALAPLLASRAIALDKNPGIRPIGIGDVFRRIITSAIMSIMKDEIRSTVGPLQTCAGHSGGIEAAVHSMKTIFQSTECEGILFVDAENAFNKLNRAAALRNIQVLCPKLANFFSNTYKQPSMMFAGSEMFLSEKGTTQGDAAAMCLYGIATIPLVYMKSDTKRVFYADDGAGAGRLKTLHSWWNALAEEGPGYGFYPNASKTYLVVKPEFFDAATLLFEDTGVKIATGRKYLGGFVGDESEKLAYTTQKCQEYCSLVERLSEVAETEPHCAFAGYTISLQRKWAYIQRVVDTPSDTWTPLESSIKDKMLPSLFGCEISVETRTLTSLPVQLGGMAIENPTSYERFWFTGSQAATASLATQIISQENTLQTNSYREGAQSIKRAKRELEKTTYVDLMSTVNVELKLINSGVCEKGASHWLTARPDRDNGFLFSRHEFRDLARMRCGVNLEQLPTKCVCSADFSIQHALQCAAGGFVGRRHNDLGDLIAGVLRGVCPDTEVEPHLHPLNDNDNVRGNLNDGARLDVSASSFWQHGQRAFF